MRLLVSSLSLSLSLLVFLLGLRTAHAFCGFYVSGQESNLYAEATQVVLMRDGTKTVLSMQNDYKGPPKDFALVIPVPVVLQKENVKTLAREVFPRLETLSSPRLVEYWEQDPCPRPEGIGLGNIGTLGHGGGTGTGQGFGSGTGRLGGVTVEAQFEVAEYEIVILSAKDSSGLDAWLRENGYKIPANAEPALKPYVAAGSKFFVAKVNVAKVTFDKEGRATLSPLRFHYDTDKFELPVKLGLLNSNGTQDLIIHILATDRYELANYPNVTIPTNLDVAESARASFGTFYTALFDRTIAKTPNAVVTEYAWTVSGQKCDPCPPGVTGINGGDVMALGADVLPQMASAALSTSSTTALSSSLVKDVSTTVAAGGGLPEEVIKRIVRRSLNRFRFCYERGLTTNPSLAGQVSTRFEIDGAGRVESSKATSTDLKDDKVIECIGSGMRALSFPESENKKKSVVTYVLRFDPPGGAKGANTPPGTAVPAVVTLTRLHARYSRDALGNDLVFKKADPIVGGRELWNAGQLEHGSVKSESNLSTFQGRYAIRHPWTKKIACENPKRGVWGGPWPDEPTSPNNKPEPEVATANKLAYAPRAGKGNTDATLASFTNATSAELDTNAAIAPAAAPSSSVAPVLSAATVASDAGVTGDGGPNTVKQASKCGCRAVGSNAPSALSIAFAGLLAAMFVSRRTSRTTL